MAQPTTAIFLNKTTPAPPTNQQNVVFQTDGATPQQSVTAYDPPLVGDTGSGGLAGNVPAPPAGSAAGGKVLGAGGSFVFPPLVIGWTIQNGTAGTGIGPMLLAPRQGLFSKCKLVVKQSDLTVALVFTILQNGTAVFTSNNTVAANTASASVEVFVNLTTVPLSVTEGDVFTLNIIGGSSAWNFTVQLET